MDPILQQVVAAVLISVVGSIVAALFVIVKRLIAEGITKLPPDIQKDIEWIAQVACTAAEQSWAKVENAGGKKKDYARQVIQEYLNSKANLLGKPIQVPDSYIDALIEVVVQGINQKQEDRADARTAAGLGVPNGASGGVGGASALHHMGFN